MNFPFDEVEGLLAPWDRTNLKKLSEMAGEAHGAEYVEIGCLYGASTLCILEGMPKDRLLYCYDWFEPDKLAKFNQNVRNAGFEKHVRPSAGDFKNGIVIPGFIAFAFVDHDHTFESTKRAYDMIWHRLEPQGILAFHDFGHPDYPGGTDFLKTLPHAPIFEDRGIIAFQR